MKHAFIKRLLAGVTIFAFGGCSVTSHTEKATGVNFNNYKTFTWAGSNNKKAANDIIDTNIKNAVTEQLEKKGWNMVALNPDVVLDYSVGVAKETKKESSQVHSNFGTQLLYGGGGRFLPVYQPSIMIGNRSRNVAVNEGSLTVNMVDAKSNKLIWQGWADEEVRSRNVTTRQVNAEVKSIFKKFN